LDEDRLLQAGEARQSAPRVVRAAEEDHGGQNDREHQADLRLTDRAPERQPQRRGEKRDQQTQDREEKRMGQPQVHAFPHHGPGAGQNDEAGDERLDHAGEDLLDGHPFDLDGSEQAILDLLAELELGDERHGNGLDARQEHRESHREP